MLLLLLGQLGDNLPSVALGLKAAEWKLSSVPFNQILVGIFLSQQITDQEKQEKAQEITPLQYRNILHSNNI